MTTLEEVKRIKQEVSSNLRKLHGVTGVGVGYKSVNGKKTSELAILVYVENKKEVAGTIPNEIQGIPVDIIESGRIVPHKEVKRIKQ